MVCPTKTVSLLVHNQGKMKSGKAVTEEVGLDASANDWQQMATFH